MEENSFESCASMREVRFCVNTRRCRRALSMDADNARGEQPQQRRVALGKRIHARRLQIYDANQFATRNHRHRQFRTHRIEGREITSIASNIVYDDGWRDAAAAPVIPSPTGITRFRTTSSRCPRE